MAWTTPRTWAVNQLVRAADLNTDLRDNLNHLKGWTNFTSAYNGGTFTTTSTSYQQVGTSSITLTLDAHPVLLIAEIASLYNSDASTASHITEVRWYNATNGTYPGMPANFRTTNVLPGSLVTIQAIGSGTFTWYLRWKNGTTGYTSTIVGINLIAVELL